MKSHDALQFIVREVERLSPGQCITISRFVLMDIRSTSFFDLFGSSFDPVDRIMENVVGSSYSIQVHRNDMKRTVTFERLKKPLDPNSGILTYVSPDRRDYYNFNGMFWIRNQISR